MKYWVKTTQMHYWSDMYFGIQKFPPLYPPCPTNRYFYYILVLTHVASFWRASEYIIIDW